MEILNIVYKGIMSDYVFATLFIFFIIGVILFFIGICNNNNRLIVFGGLLSVLSFLIIIGLSIYDKSHTSNKVDYYEVTLNEDIKLTEFNAKYEIIEQRGKIYKIRERK